MKKVFIGIDTSNYTTSCAISSENGEILHNFKILLPVSKGERGLRQSDAVFAHIKNLKLIADKVREACIDAQILAIGYSAFPRDAEGSYMPCFLTGDKVQNMEGQMKNMMNFMLIMILFTGFMLPAALAIYWTIGSVFMIVQTLVFQSEKVKAKLNGFANRKKKAKVVQ